MVAMSWIVQQLQLHGIWPLVAFSTAKLMISIANRTKEGWTQPCDIHT